MASPRASWIPVLCILLAGSPLLAATPEFESPPVHPLDLTADGTRLLAVNLSDHRVSVFDVVWGARPLLVAEIPVGLDPVTVRARSNTEVWVVNHLSDSISLIDLDNLSVFRTIPVGDEPTDVVFAGSPERAFVSLSQEDRVAVLDPVSGVEVASIPLAASDPRSLAVSADGLRVFVTVLESGNETTIVPETVVTSTMGLPPPTPSKDPGNGTAPDAGLLVRHNGTNWEDELGRNWDSTVPYRVLDDDVLVIDVPTLTVSDAYVGVGTNLFNVAENPVSGRLYVTNQEADNHVRFEPNLIGRFARMRVTTIDPAGPTVAPVHLNAHIDYNNTAGSPAERALSLSLPLDVTVSADGQTVYVAAFGSSQVGVLDANGQVTDRLPVGDGPAGLALDGNRLFVLNRISGSISVVDLQGGLTQTVHLGYDATSESLREGRRLFYSGENSSAHGDLSCATCHVFGGFDNIGWDLGDPQAAFAPAPPGQFGSSGFHPMKGPMATQSLKGLAGTEPFHWRGDRADLAAFNPAFQSLMGRSTQLSPSDFQLFEDFVLSLAYPPNPFRDLNGGLPNPPSGPNPTNGETLYLSGGLVGGAECVDCHALPTGENGVIIPAAALLEPQDMVVPQLRNMYEKTGFDNTVSTTVRGFGYTHDGAIDDLFSFLGLPQFSFANDDDKRDVEAFLLAFDTGTPAAVGAQWTMDGTNEAQGLARVNTLVALADAGTVDLVVRGQDGNGVWRGWWYQGTDIFLPDRTADPSPGLAGLLAQAGPGTERTFTAVPLGCGERHGIDRDEDGFRDRDEVDQGSDPADPASTPATVGIPGGRVDPGSALTLFPNPARSGVAIGLADAPAGLDIRIHDVRGRTVRVLPQPQSAGSSVTWDLTDDRGRAVAAGIYFVSLQEGPDVRGNRLVVIR